MAKLVYFIGIPGAGKTTLMNALLAPLQDKLHLIDRPFARQVTADGELVVLGKPRKDFGGTDSLGMNVQPKVVDWLKGYTGKLVLGEGDRLGNKKFFTAVQASDRELHVIFLNTTQYTAAQRRQQRGSQQNEQWLKGRLTKVFNLARDCATCTLSGAFEVDEMVYLLQRNKQGILEDLFHAYP